MMPHDLEQSAIGVKLGQASRLQAPRMALSVGQVGIVDAGAASALEFTADRTR